MITIILPVYNDWSNLFEILKKIEKIARKAKTKVNILVVNDSSTNKYNYQRFGFGKIVYLNLKKNIGSQKAIATGLNFAIKKKLGDKFIIMDSDGEDNPDEISKIIKLTKKNKIDTITMNRKLRHESLLFSFLYEIHLIITLFLTFHYIRFGNFSFLSLNSAKKISSKKDLWIAYSSTISKYLINKKVIKAERKNRISGKSKMKYWQLFFHSLRILAVFKNTVFITSIFYLIIAFNIFNLNFYNIYFLLIFFSLSFVNLMIYGIHTYFEGSKLRLFNCLKNIKSIKAFR
tara:strand:- start:404 stop:1270 length:867 start_codon:yes stop_codon:yes gene_type:complete